MNSRNVLKVKSPTYMTLPRTIRTANAVRLEVMDPAFENFEKGEKNQSSTDYRSSTDRHLYRRITSLGRWAAQNEGGNRTL